MSTDGVCGAHRVADNALHFNPERVQLQAGSIHGEFELTISGESIQEEYTFTLKAERADNDEEIEFIFPYVDTAASSEANAVVIKGSQVTLGKWYAAGVCSQPRTHPLVHETRTAH